MRWIFTILLITTTALSTTIKFGRDTIFEGTSLTFENVSLLVDFISDSLEYDEPKIVSNSTFTLLQFNGKSVLFSAGRMALGSGTPSKITLSVEEFLDFFDIPYEKEENVYLIPECLLENFETIGRNVTIEYYGNPAFHYEMKGKVLRVISEGYVMYAGKVYKPDEVILEIETSGTKIGKIAEKTGKDVVEILRKNLEDRIVIVAAGSGLLPPLPVGSFGVVVAKGNGIVIVRPPSPDLEGLDEDAYESSLEIAMLVSRRLGYRFEKAPVIDIPPGTPGVFILVRNEEELEEIVNMIGRVMGIEKIVNSAPPFSELPDLGG